MLPLILFFIAVMCELVFLLGIAVYLISLIYSSLKGAPYVPTKKHEIEVILKNAHLKRGQLFMELGSGDGRVAAAAVQNFHLTGIGVDINPALIFWARWKHRRIKNLEFRTQNIFDTDLQNVDVLYLFLMPELLEKLKIKMNRELNSSARIISHGFKIPGWDARVEKILKREPFPTYYYKRRA